MPKVTSIKKKKKHVTLWVTEFEDDYKPQKSRTSFCASQLIKHCASLYDSPCMSGKSL